MLRYVKLGNLKVAKAVGRFDLPTSVCGKPCHRCYASKMQFPAVVAYRQRCLDLAESDGFVEVMNREIRESRVRVFRPHCSGEFYSQTYVDKWIEIVKSNPDIKFFAWTKRIGVFDFSELPANFNLMNSMTPLGINYGTQEHVDRLVEEYSYFQCPDTGSHDVCFHYDGCDACLTQKKVCFLVH